MRVLVTGSTGQLGHDLIRSFPAAEVTGFGSSQLDVRDRAAVHTAVASCEPDLVVHAAAWTAVDACEADPDRAFAVNALGTRHVAEAADRAGAHVVYVSTDYVFDGTKDTPYDEWDEPAPRSVYGTSKLAGERELPDGATVVRTSWLCSARGSNMVRTVLRLADERDTLAFVDDQRGCPTFSDDLAACIATLALDGRRGTYHVTNQGPTTWFAFARAILEEAGADPDRVVPITTDELDPPRPAHRPANSVLDNRALRLQGLPLLADHREALSRVVKELTTS